MIHSNKHIHSTVDHLFRHESGKMTAVLSRLMGLHHLEAAQDIVQDSLLLAMNTWPYRGVPDNPAGWLYRVASNKAVDYLRRLKKWEDISPQYVHLLQSEYTLTTTVQQLFLEHEIEDSMLRMLFACCHPSIPLESQLAVALKTLCGLNNAEIAKGFLTSEDTIAKRIYRAREKMRVEKVNLELPHSMQLGTRLDAVLHCLYLLFNEGYNASHADQLIREELCEEAMRLALLLCENPFTALPRTYALLALFCFQASRFGARMDEQENIILLQRQNREQWYEPLIHKGLMYLEQAAIPYEVTTYHLEAGIAAIHAVSPTFEQTDWKSIYRLYEVLYHLQPQPVIALNKAIAAAYAISPAEALRQLLIIKGLEKYYLYYTAIGEMYFLLQQKDEALCWFQKALPHIHTNPEKKLVFFKMDQCRC